MALSNRLEDGGMDRVHGVAVRLVLAESAFHAGLPLDPLVDRVADERGQDPEKEHDDPLDLPGGRELRRGRSQERLAEQVHAVAHGERGAQVVHDRGRDVPERGEREEHRGEDHEEELEAVHEELRGLLELDRDPCEHEPETQESGGRQEEGEEPLPDVVHGEPARDGAHQGKPADAHQDRDREDREDPRDEVRELVRRGEVQGLQGPADLLLADGEPDFPQGEREDDVHDEPVRHRPRERADPGGVPARERDGRGYEAEDDQEDLREERRERDRVPTVLEEGLPRHHPERLQPLCEVEAGETEAAVHNVGVQNWPTPWSLFTRLSVQPKNAYPRNGTSHAARSMSPRTTYHGP